MVAYTLGTCAACASGPTVNDCMGRSTPDGSYHDHADANCVAWHPTRAQTWDDYSWSTTPNGTHSPIIGYAVDGYPIYATFGYGADGLAKEMRSSYELKAGKSGAGGIADDQYVEGLGDLDACNGKWAVTPDFPGCTYAYFSARHSSDGGNGSPYVLNCYHGVVDNADLTMR